MPNIQKEKYPKKIISNNVFILFFRIWNNIKPRRQKQLLLLVVLTILGGFFELISLGSIYPFIALISNPSLVRQNKFFQLFEDSLGIMSSDHLILIYTCIFCLVVGTTALVRLVNIKLNFKLAAAVGTDISQKAYANVLNQTYEYHMNQNSSSIITTITVQTSRTVNSLICFLQMLTSTIVALFIASGLLFADAKVTLWIFFIFSFTYLFIVQTNKRQISRNSQLLVVANRKVLKILQESLGFVRDVIIGNSQEVYIKSYSRYDKEQRMIDSNNNFLASYPKYIIESAGLIAIAILASSLLMIETDDPMVLPLLATIALGIQKLLPSLQQIYNNWTVINSYKADLIGILEYLDFKVKTSHHVNKLPIDIQKIEFRSVSFSYKNSESIAIEDANFSVTNGEKIGIVGKTGSGKSTLIDLLMGLISPTEGTILLNNKDFYGEKLYLIEQYRNQIAHVPQHIYLSDSSILENIAFGVPLEEIDFSRACKAAQIAQIHDYVESCPKGYNTEVGERGVRISGGQLQRIGIARALYNYDKIKILVLDEATSALDSQTEENLMNAIYNHTKHLTIFMIAHRLSTLKRCDRILSISNSRVKEINKNTLIHPIIDS